MNISAPNPSIYLGFIGFLLLFCSKISGQNQRNLFFNSFTNVVRLDFATEPPIPYGTGVAGSYEGIAHYEDGSGNLLFWFNSNGVYNQNGTLMPGSFGILANSSSAEMCVAPVPGNPNRYYFLYNAETCSALYYAIVDMSLNGGLGNVVSVNTLISSAQHSEGMEVVRIPNSNNYWFITYRCGTGFTRYLISETGISAGTVFHSYPMPTGGYDGRGNLDYHRGRIGAAFAWSSQVFTAEFDPVNGTVCNPITLSSTQFNNNPFGVEFSPDASKMYFSLWYTNGQPNVFQYNFATGSFTGYLPPYGGGGGFISGLGEIEMGRNGKLYIIQDGGSNITVINNPNDNVPNFGFIPIPGSTGLGISDHIQSDVFNNDDNTITLCADVGSIITLQSAVAGNYEWTASNNPNVVLAIGPSLWISAPNLVTTYTATNIDVSSCLTLFNQHKWTVYPNPIVTANNSSPVCLGANVMLSANSTSSGITGYQWIGPNGFTSTQQNPIINNAFFSNEGIYTVAVYGENGCTSFATTTVTVSSPPNVAVSNSGPACSGGSIMLAADTSLPGSATNYLWNGPNGFISTLQNPILNGVTESQSGIYSLVVTVNGCASNPVTTNVMIVPQPDLVVSSNGPVCLGSMLLLSASTTATGVNSYFWSGPAGFSSTIQNPFIMNFLANNAGVYTVTLTSAGGCTASASVNVLTNGNAIVAGINNMSGTNSLTCGTSSIFVLATGGETYQWSGGNSPNTANNNLTSPGTYTVTVTGSNGCTNTTSITITQDAALPMVNIANNTGTTVLTCTTTAINITATGGGAYNWGGGITTATRTITSPGTYTVTVTGSNGCTNTASITITSNTTPPTAGITNNTGTTVLTCATTSISLTATGGGAYNWGGGITTATRTITSPGTYTVTVTSSNGCTNTASITITSNTTPPTAGITNNTGTTVLTCATTSISLTATGGGTYNWGGGITTATRTITSPGTYTVTVTGSNNCTASTSISITQNTVSPDGTIINNTNSTELNCTYPTINVTATGGISYQWSGGSITNEANNFFSSAGLYTVTITGSNGCTATASISITQDFTSPVATITTNTGLPELNCNNPSVVLTATGGTSFDWGSGLTSDPNYVVSSPAQPPNNNYTVTVTSDNGCTASSSILINANFFPPFIVINSNTGTTELSCIDTIITLTASGGETYNWGMGNTNPIVTISTSGTYTVTTTGSNGCTNSASINITATSDSDITVSGIIGSEPNITCFSTTNYSVSFVISGGTPPYWVNGSPISGSAYNSSTLNTYTYSFNITDAQGCSYLLTGNSAFCNLTCEVSAALQPVYYGAGCIDGFEVVVSGGPPQPPTYQYAVNGSAWQLSPQFIGLEAGSYAVSVLTGCGVQNLGTFTQSLSALQVLVSITPAGAGNYQGSVSIVGGSSPYNVFWSNGNTGLTTNLGSLPGMGTVTITDAAGCTRVVQFTKDGAVGIAQQPDGVANQLSVYPNPARDYLTVTAQMPTDQPAQVYLFTPYGQLIAQRQTHFTQPEVFDLHYLPAGLYLLTVAEGDAYRTFKIWCSGGW